MLAISPRQTISRLLFISCLLTGCVNPAGGPPSTREKSVSTGSSRILPSSAPVLPMGSLVRTPANGGLVNNNGGNVVSNNSVGLSGTVRAPAALVANNGGGLIANNGGGLVANNGSGYRLLAALNQSTISNATVRVLDATGQAVKDAKGQPLTAKTDAQGRYHLPTVVPNANLVLAIDLYGKGELQALAMRTNDEGLTVDIDVVSTLTTGYVRELVASQTEKQQTLDKLTPALEAETRSKAAAVFATNTVSLPSALDANGVSDTVLAMRHNDTGFDAQLETVKKALIAGGQEDFGAGQLATEVPIKLPSALLQAADGSLLIASVGERRVWRIGADGRLRPYLGGGETDRADLTGVAATQAMLGAPDAMAYDSQGRLVLHDSHFIPNAPNSSEGRTVDRLLRLEADGTLKSLFAAEIPGAVVGMFPLADDGFGWLIQEPREDGSARFEIWRFDARGALGKTPITSPESLQHLSNYPTSLNSVDAAGKWLLSDTTADSDTQETSLYLLRLDPVTGQLQADKQTFEGQLAGNPTGGYFQVADALTWVRPDGTKPFPAWSLGSGDSPDVAHVTPDGTLYYALEQQVFKVQGGKKSLVAGASGQPGAGPLALQDLETVLARPDGLFVIAYGGKVQRLNADRSLTLVADVPSASDPLTGFVPKVLRNGRNGELFASSSRAICTLDTTNGRYQARFQLPQGSDLGISDFLPMADGSIYYIASSFEESALFQLPAGSQTPTRVRDLSIDEDGLAGEGALALDAKGRLHLLDHTGQLLRLENGQFKPVVAFNDFAIFGNSSIAFAPDGRLYVPDVDRVLRYDPRLGRIETIAGRGGRFFNGRTPDTSLGWVQDISVNAAGDLFLADEDSRQVKQIRASDL